MNNKLDSFCALIWFAGALCGFIEGYLQAGIIAGIAVGTIYFVVTFLISLPILFIGFAIFSRNLEFESRIFFLTWVLSGIIGFAYCEHTESWILSPLHAYVYFLAGFFPALILSILSGVIRRSFRKNAAEQGTAATP
jgi:hypothetical protein